MDAAGSPPQLGRRTLLRGFGYGAAALGGAALVGSAAAGASAAPAATRAAATGRPPLRPRALPPVRLAGGHPVLNLPPGAPEGDAARLHLLRRATYGPTPDSLAELAALGIPGWLERQLAPDSLPDPACDAAMARFTVYASSAQQVAATHTNGSWDAMLALQQVTLLRAVASTRQLAEVMTEFWQNHFNITVPSDKVWHTAHVHDREVIRPRAMGRFADLLAAVAASPAMLYYLDNADSNGSDPNENFGRELLELHTVGLEAGYSEADVRNSAYAMTGWSVEASTALFGYRPDYRYVGPLTVLGWSDPNAGPDGGLAVGRSYLDYLAHHPATARRIARKLAVRFVRDDPSEALVSQLAQCYLAHDTAIVPVLRMLFFSAEFWTSAGGKLRRPLEDTVAALRVLGTRPSTDTGTAGWEGLVWGLRGAGHGPLSWPQPDGYPDTADHWCATSAVLARFNLHQALADRWWTEGIVTPDPATLVPGGVAPATAGAWVDALVRRILLADPTPVQRSALLGFLGLAAGAPVPAWMFNSRASVLIMLILNTPEWSQR